MSATKQKKKKARFTPTQKLMVAEELLAQATAKAQTIEIDRVDPGLVTLEEACHFFRCKRSKFFQMCAEPESLIRRSSTMRGRYVFESLRLEVKRLEQL
jgi:hypothetical protein